MSRTVNKIIYAFISLLFAAIVGSTVYILVTQGKDSLVTAIVELTSVKDGIAAQSVIVRDEELIYKENGRHYLPLLKTGERISAGKSIAISFSTYENVSAYEKLMQVESKIKLLEAITNQESSVDAVEYNRGIYSVIRDISGLGARGLVNLKLDDARFSLEKSVLSMSYLLGEYTGITGDINRLKEEKKVLDSMITESPEYLKAEKAGYFSQVPDGRERLLRFGELKNMTPEAFKTIMDGEPSLLPDSVFGKMIYGYDWYAAALVKSKDAEQLETDGKYILETTGESFDVKVEAKNLSEDGTFALIVMKCSLAPKDMSASRVQACRIILKTYDGFKIPHEALRVVDGQAGVFVIEGVRVIFKPVNILFKGASFYVVAASHDDRKELFLYDEVILNRENLYDGKIIG